MITEIWLDKINTQDGSIDGYLSSLREYLLTPSLMSRRKQEMCTVHQGTKSKEFSLGQMLVSSYFLRILAHAGIKLELVYFFESREATDLNDYIDKISRIYEEKRDDIKPLKEGISQSIVELSDDTARVVSLRGSSISLFELGRLAKEHKEFYDLLHFEIPDGLELNEIEKMVETKVDEMLAFLSSTPSSYQELIKGEAVSKRQLGQSIVNVGLKPDIEGMVNPDPINTSFIRGLRNRKDFLTCATGARKALLINFCQVKLSGYMARKLSLLTLKSTLSEEEYCDTKFTIPVEIKNAKTLKRLEGRVTENGHVITEKDVDLIGTKIGIYSPITCNCKTGICKRCYGKLAIFNKDYHVGIAAVLLLTDPLTQMLLSSKHLLMAKTEKVDWPEDFGSAFFLDRDSIYPTLENGKIVIDVANIAEDEEGDLYTKVVTAKIRNRLVRFVSPKKLFLRKEEVKKYAKESKSITIEPDQSISCFFIKMRNVELSSTLTSIIDLLSQSDHDGFGNDICGILNSFLDRLNDSKIGIASVHAEVILANLLTQAGTNQRPDFSEEKENLDLQVASITEAIMNNEALSTSFAFEQIKKQINSTKTYLKTKAGIFDRLFV